MYVVCGILQNWSLYPHTLMYFYGTWTQWSLETVTHVTSTAMGIRGHLGVSDLWFKVLKKGSLYPHTLMYFHGTWAESHMWPHQTWGQRSSRGQWPLVQVSFWKKCHYPHTLMYFHGTWIHQSFGRVTHVISTEVGSKVILGSLTFWLSFFFFLKMFTVSTYLDVLPWELDTMILG